MLVKENKWSASWQSGIHYQIFAFLKLCICMFFCPHIKTPVSISFYCSSVHVQIQRGIGGPDPPGKLQVIKSPTHAYLHSMKICMWFGYNPQNIFCVGPTIPTVLYWFSWNSTGVLVVIWRYACGLGIILRLCFVTFSQVELSHFSGIFYYFREWTGDTLWAQLLLQFFTDSSETSLVFWSWSEDYACDLDMILRLFLLLFHNLNLVLFQALYITRWMDREYLVCATPPTVLYRFFWNFTGVLVMVWRYACGLDLIFRSFLSYKTSLSLMFFTIPAFFAFSAINILSISIYM